MYILQSRSVAVCVLQSVHVPMSVKAIERLIRKLDTDGDGEVDYA